MTSKAKTLVARALSMLFQCDTARITSPCDRHFLILGWNKNTKTEREAGRACGKWSVNNEPIDFDYVHEEVVASGHTLKELWRNAKRYKRLIDD